MKISEYIHELHKIQTQHGDLDVVDAASVRRLGKLADGPYAQIRYKDEGLYFDNNDDGLDIEGEMVCLI